MDFSADGRTLAMGDRKGNVTFWDVTDAEDPTTRATLPLGSPVYDLQFGPGGQDLVTVDSTQAVRLWDQTGAGTYVYDLTDPDRPAFVSRLAAGGIVDFDPRSRILVAADELPGAAQLWDITYFRQEHPGTE